MSAVLDVVALRSPVLVADCGGFHGMVGRRDRPRRAPAQLRVRVRPARPVLVADDAVRDVLAEVA